MESVPNDRDRRAGMDMHTDDLATRAFGLVADRRQTTHETPKAEARQSKTNLAPRSHPGKISTFVADARILVVDEMWIDE